MAILKILVFLTYLPVALAFIPKTKIHTNISKKVKFFNKEIIQYKRSNLKLKKEINKFEKKLSLINIKYVKFIGRRSIIDQKLIELKAKQNILKKDFQHFQKKFEHLKLQYVLDHSNDNEDNAEDLLIEQYYLSKMKKMSLISEKLLLNQKIIMLDIKKQNKLIPQIISQLKLYEELAKEWESNKSKKVRLFLDHKNIITSYTDKITLLKIKLKRKKRGLKKLAFFSWPLKKYLGVKFKKKGVTFSFNKYLDILNTRTGIVAHVGKLSNYGTIVIIKHSKKLKSVFLGNYKSQVKVGDHLKQGDLIGMTSPKEKGHLGKLYFEIRKNKKAQNTISLLKAKI